MRSVIKDGAKLLKEKIGEFDTIVIFRHQSPDYDAFGSQLGLKTWINDNYPSKKVYAVGHNHVVFTNTLYPEMDEVDLSELNGEYLAIVCDTGDTKRIDDDRYKDARFIIKFDHHPPRELYGHSNFIIDELSSCAELITSVITHSTFKGNVLSKLAAKYLFSGIVGDSGRFQYPSTTSSTFKAAAKLIDTGIDMQKDVYQPMYLKSVKDLEVSKYLLNNYHLSEHGKVAYYFMDDEHQRLFDINVDRGKENLGFFSNYKEIVIWVSFTEDVENNNWRVSVRSREIGINGVCEKYRGGGHLNASGARVLNKEEALELIKDLDALTI